MLIETLQRDLPTSILAVATTIHLAMLLMRLHRSGSGGQAAALAFPSFVAAGTPWLFPSPAGLAVGFVLHGLWFVACERLAGAAQVAVASAATPTVSKSVPTSKPMPSPRKTTPTPTAPDGFVQVPVFAVFKETPDIKTFRMARPEGFEFQAGQFVVVRVSVDGKHVTRCYSVSSGPQSSGYLEISVKKQGLMSGTLHATIRPGSMLSIRNPTGAFFFPDGDDRPLTLLAGGIGITPLMSMLRHAVNAAPNRPVTMLYSVMTRRDVVFAQELRWIAERHPQVKIRVAITQGPREEADLEGRIDARMIAEQVPDLEDSICLICGPGPMMDAMRSVLADLGVPDDQIRYEAFEAAVAAAQAEIDLDRLGVGEEEADEESGGYQLELLSSGRTLEAGSRLTLLETCEAAGVEIPTVCRAGVCGTCRTRVASGSVRCDSDILCDQDQADGYVLACVAFPQGDCAIEA